VGEFSMTPHHAAESAPSVSTPSSASTVPDDAVLLELVTDEAMEWQERALCAQTDPEAFFPEKGGSTREAKRVCLSCEVRVECLEYALANDERFGIWGGLSERERRRLKKQAV
jgi:WhiB family transcriptional regulator, redox-sensing transcriptional regulator